MNILAMDVSGNFAEGKGTTGWCVMKPHETIGNLQEIKADKYDSAEAYWNEHLEVIGLMHLTYPDTHVVVEGFRLYGNKAKDQINSTFETPMLIGLIRWFCFMGKIPLTLQYATEVKNRWSEDVLIDCGILELKNGLYYHDGKLTNNHKRDSLKHALHFARYGVKKL